MTRRYAPLPLVAAVGMALGLLAQHGRAAPAFPVDALPLPDTAVECPLTPYLDDGLGDSFTSTWFGGGDLWAGLYGGEHGLWYAEPEFAKVHWSRPDGEPLTIEGRRLDASAPPLDARIPVEYLEQQFQVTILTFPTAGCWEIVGRIPGRELRFVVLVHPGDEFHNAPPPPPGLWETLARPLELAAVAAGKSCPRTPGRTISRVEGVVLGDGPVYVQGFGIDARVPLGDPAASGAPLPIPIRWVTDPTYLGPLLIRGQRLDGLGSPRFGVQESFPAMQWWDLADLTTPDWSVWRMDIPLPGPGCYALRIDGLDFTQVIVFEVVPGPRTVPAEPQPHG